MKTQEINKAFQALSWAFDSSMVNHALKLFELCKGEEKSHRSFGADFAKYHPNAPSVADMARLFAVKRVAEYLQGEEMPSGSDYLHFHHSAFYAAGMVDEYRDTILNAWKGFDLAALAALDYTHYVKVKAAA